MKKRKIQLYDAVCAALLLITLFFLVLTVKFSTGSSVNFNGAVTTAVLAFGGVLAFGSLFARRLSGGAVKKTGFYLAHAGVVLILVGFALFQLFGDTVTAAVPVGGDTFYSQIQRESGEMCDLGFNFRVDDFEIETYEDGSDKQYYAGLAFADEVTLRVDTSELSVNHTVRRGGWKIYLMNYSSGYVSLMFRRDPGEYVVKAGIAALIAGCVLSLIAGNGVRKKEENADA